MGASSEWHISMQDELINTVHQAEEGELSNLDALIELRDNRKHLETGLEIIKQFEDEKINEIASEAHNYPEGYKGVKVTLTNGRKMYSYKGIPEVESHLTEVKKAEEKYRAAFDGVQKGIIEVVESEDGSKGWVDTTTGDILPFPEVNYGKSFLTVKQTRK